MVEDLQDRYCYLLIAWLNSKQFGLIHVPTYSHVLDIAAGMGGSNILVDPIPMI